MVLKGSNMFHYYVWVRSAQYRGNQALTYESSNKLLLGTVVEVSLRKQKVPGIIIKEVPKPVFPTKPIDNILDIPALPKVTLELAVWLQKFYPSPIGVITQLFIPKTINLNKQNEYPETALVSPIQPPLTADQKLAIGHIQKPDTYILHGRTGSGKTRVYTELAAKTIKNDRSVLILSPEIGLTSQLAITFRQIFGNRVIVLHSQLTDKQRGIAWLRVLKAKSPIIVIGPRSALFSPITNLGLIVVDESHDQAYKQGQSPYYHAARVASQLSHIHQAILLFGSATPSVTDYYMALEKHKPVIHLDQLAITQYQKHNVTIVDLKNRDQFPRVPHVSLPLIQAMTRSLERNEQSLLYLNRRGTARIMLCQKCGWQALCSRCDLPLTYHGDKHQLQCHICGYHQIPVTNCPKCGNTEIILHGFGTKAVVEEASRIFPEAHILRFDTDNLKSERLENQYQNIIDGKVDILIGTQVLAKGLDLPRLSTLGIIAADSSLYLPDYTAQERTYQLLTQVLGRIGRGHIDSQAIIQTYHPDSQLLKASLQNDWDSFYAAEIQERQRYKYPPFCHLLKLTCKRTSAVSAEKASQIVKDKLVSSGLAIQVEGPAPAFHEKVSDKYYWQLVIKAKNRSSLLSAIAEIPTNGWSYDIDPIDLL
jgi:primosomal protein N' (replication factor Y)